MEQGSTTAETGSMEPFADSPVRPGSGGHPGRKSQGQTGTHASIATGAEAAAVAPPFNKQSWSALEGGGRDFA